MTEQDVSTATALHQQFQKNAKRARSAAMLELKTVDNLFLIGTGCGLSSFIPEYFQDGPKVLVPGHLKDILPLAGLPPLPERKFLRLLGDREKVGGAFVGFLTSRLRVMEVNDPAHVLWRICILAIQASGLKGAVRISCLKK